MNFVGTILPCFVSGERMMALDRGEKFSASTPGRRALVRQAALLEQIVEGSFGNGGEEGFQGHGLAP
jgi:hypothetical protein